MGKPGKGVSPLSLTEARCALSLGILLFSCLKASRLSSTALSSSISSMQFAAVYLTLDKAFPFFALQFPYLSNKDDIKNPKSYL